MFALFQLKGFFLKETHAGSQLHEWKNKFNLAFKCVGVQLLLLGCLVIGTSTQIDRVLLQVIERLDTITIQLVPVVSSYKNGFYYQSIFFRGNFLCCKKLFEAVKANSFIFCTNARMNESVA